MGRAVISPFAGAAASVTVTPDVSCQTFFIANEGTDTFTVAVTEADGDVKTLTVAGGSAYELIFNPITSVTITNASTSNYVGYFVQGEVESPLGYYKSSTSNYPTAAVFGSSGTAGSVTIYPTTASKGSLLIDVADQTGDTQVNINVDEMGQATVVNLPDPGAATTYLVQSTLALTLAEVDVLDGATAGTQVASKAVIADANINTGVSKVTELHIGATGAETQVNATAAELNKAADLSAQIQTITSSGAQAITAGVQAVYLNEATTAVAATVATAVAHQGLFLIKAGLEPAGGQDHTCTLTIGTWDGTNNVATFADINDSLLVYFDAAGAGTILVNTGSVALS